MCDQNSASTQSIADYLAQLLKDRKQLAAFPNVFLHVERLLDEGKSLWSVALCVWNAISIKTNLQNPNFHKINTTKITCDIAERDLIQHKRSNQVFFIVRAYFKARIFKSLCARRTCQNFHTFPLWFLRKFDLKSHLFTSKRKTKIWLLREFHWIGAALSDFVNEVIKKLATAGPLLVHCTKF